MQNFTPPPMTPPPAPMGGGNPPSPVNSAEQPPQNMTPFRINILTRDYKAIEAWKRQRIKTIDEDVISWQGVPFVFNDKVGFNDIVVIDDYPPNDVEIKVSSPFHVIHLNRDPAIKHDENFVNQFRVIFSSHEKPASFPHQWHTCFGLHPWQYGFKDANEIGVTLDWDGLCYQPIKTNNKLSIISPLKMNSSWNLAQQQFVSALLASDLASQIDLFGQTDKVEQHQAEIIKDKADGLFHYPYSLVMEDIIQKDYWGADLADAVLAQCVVFYIGCPNIQDYFNTDSIISLDINDPQGAIATIKKTMADDRWNKSMETIKENKKKLLHEYNLYPFIIKKLVDIGVIKTGKIDPRGIL